LNERATHAEDVVKLLGKRRATHGPKAASDATRHDDTIILVVHDFPCALDGWKSRGRKNRQKIRIEG
jgi:hypothetical protein